MKIKILYVALSALLLSSCKGFLDENAYSVKTGDNMYKKYEDADMAVKGIYSILSSANAYRQPWQCLTTYGTDEAINFVAAGTMNANFYRVSNYSLTASDSPISALYQVIYTAILNANDAYWQIDKMNMRTDLKEKLQAEALFIRAFCYFNLVQLWGEVRLGITKPKLEDITARDVTRTSVGEVYAQIVEDIEFAKKYLPESWAGSNRGRATKYAAYGLASKIYLTMASGSKYGVAGYDFDPTEYYTLAKENANTVLTDGKTAQGYDLMENYEDVFSTKFKYNKEILFDITFCIGGPGNAYPKSGGPLGAGIHNYYTSGWTGRGYVRPSLYLALTAYGHNSMNVNDDGGITELISNDVRLGFNIATYTLNKTTGLPNNDLRANPAEWTTSKFSMRTTTLEGGYQWQNAPMNHPILRVADVLLIYAEAAGMLSLADRSAYDAANKVRARARTKDKTPTYLVDWTTSSFADTDEFMDAILAERMRELCFEGHRRFDLLRTSRLFSAMDKMRKAAKDLGEQYNNNFYNLIYNSDITNQQYDVNVKPYHILFPIPQYEMNIVTNPDYKQNPGYLKAADVE